MIKMRKKFSKTEFAPRNLRAIVENIVEKENILGLEEPGLKERILPGAETLYFAGCLSLYKRKEIAKSTIEILRKSGVVFSILGPKEYCCGFPLLSLGLSNLVEDVMQKNVECFRRIGARRIVVSCANCYWMLKEVYSKRIESFDFEILHSSELILELLKKKYFVLRKRLPLRIAYHDPCILSRYVDLSDKPRAILQRIKEAELVEMNHERENTLCCGAGGGLLLMRRDIVEKVAIFRIKEALEAEADLLVTSCPFCYESLEEAGKPYVMPVADLAEVVASTM
jgi:Fe-S oxidoreductase